MMQSRYSLSGGHSSSCSIMPIRLSVSHRNEKATPLVTETQIQIHCKCQSSRQFTKRRPTIWVETMFSLSLNSNLNNFRSKWRWETADNYSYHKTKRTSIQKLDSRRRRTWMARNALVNSYWIIMKICRLRIITLRLLSSSFIWSSLTSVQMLIVHWSCHLSQVWNHINASRLCSDMLPISFSSRCWSMTLNSTISSRSSFKR